MYKNMKPQYAIIIAAATTAISASAQISREITVEREVVPIERKASRISLMPNTVQPKVEKTAIKFSDRPVETEITPLRAVLEPATTDEADSAAVNQRGYVDLGYFPTFNLGVSAGYRLLATDQSTADAWLQYNGHSYDRHSLDNKRNTFTIGGTVDHRIDSKSGIEAALSYTYDANKWQTLEPDFGPSAPASPSNGVCDRKLNAHRFGITAGYYGRTAAWSYRIALQGGYNAITVDKDMFIADRSSEALYGLKGGVAYATGDKSRAGLRVDWQMRSESLSKGFEGSTMGMVNLNPYWMGPLLEGMNVELGLNADFSINSGTTANFSPECAISWAPRGSMSAFAVEVKATGGLYANTLASLLDYTPYIYPSYDAYNPIPRIIGNSRVPYDLAATVTIGPFSGAYLEISGEYAKADDWMMPMVMDGNNIWAATDVKGWMVGAKVGYRFHDLGEISVAYRHASNDGDKAFYRWRDRAKQAIESRLTLTPIKPLAIDLGYDARWGRNVTAVTTAGVSPAYGEIALGCCRNLWVGASYRFTPQFTVFARGENLLGNDSQLIYGIAEQGLTGLVGAQLTF